MGLTGALCYLMHFLLDIFYEVWNAVFKSHTPTPPITDDVLLLSATQLAADIRCRERTSVSVVEAFVRRIRCVNPTLNCLVADRFSAALAEAAEVDAILDSDPKSDSISKERKPFLGVPFTAKDFFAIKGLPNTCGCVSLKDHIATEDAVAVARMREAGAIPLGLTNVPELCMWWETNCQLWGRTRNVYDNRRIVGGSSGGEGCIISAAGSVFGLGSDIGGSIRVPSFFNGVFGHKPSRYLVPNKGQYPWDPREDLLNTSGPLCRYAEDLLPTLRVLAGEEKSEDLKLNKPIDLNKMCLKVYSCTAFDDELEPELRQAQSRVAAFLSRIPGATVQEQEFPHFRGFVGVWAGIKASTGAPSICQLMGLPRDTPVDPFKERKRWLLGLSQHTYPVIMVGCMEKSGPSSPSALEENVETGRRAEEELNKLLGDDGVLLCPTATDYAYFHNQPIHKEFDPMYTTIFSALGCPVTQVPLGLGRKGVPLGLQVVAAKNNDRLSIAVAELLGDEFGGWVKPN